MGIKWTLPALQALDKNWYNGLFMALVPWRFFYWQFI